ncbi:hypothetical protein IAE22_28955, partial [Bacillus sp. S34]|nr:hypothetical protein [Bacillus sp. S34]
LRQVQPDTAGVDAVPDDHGAGDADDEGGCRVVESDADGPAWQDDLPSGVVVARIGERNAMIGAAAVSVVAEHRWSVALVGAPGLGKSSAAARVTDRVAGRDTSGRTLVVPITAVVTADNAATAQDQARSDASQTAGLSVTKTADVETVDAGKDVTYTITVANPAKSIDTSSG